TPQVRPGTRRGGTGTPSPCGGRSRAAGRASADPAVRPRPADDRDRRHRSRDPLDHLALDPPASGSLVQPVKRLVTLLIALAPVLASCGTGTLVGPLRIEIDIHYSH